MGRSPVFYFNTKEEGSGYSETTTKAPIPENLSTTLNPHPVFPQGRWTVSRPETTTVRVVGIDIMKSKGRHSLYGGGSSSRGRILEGGGGVGTGPWGFR